MANQNWPRDTFGVDLNRVFPQSQQSIGGSVVRTPSLIFLPDSSSGVAVSQIQITSGGTYIVGDSTYDDLLLNVNAPVTIQLGSSLNRGGYPVGISDIGGFLSANNCTILPFAAQQIMGLSELVLSTNRTGLMLFPISTGDGGWYTK